jgi:hypothetical protein
MSVEFTRGPNIYLRETVAGDLDNIKDSLVDWDYNPLSIDQTKRLLKGALIQMRFIERPYEDTTQCKETFTVCKNSDNSFVGFVHYTVMPGKLVTIKFNAALPALRKVGLMNEAAKLIDAAIFTELQCASCDDKHDTDFISNLRAYQTLEGTQPSKRSVRTLKLVKTIKTDYDTWRAANASSVPSYTFSGGSYTPPHQR